MLGIKLINPEEEAISESFNIPGHLKEGDNRQFYEEKARPWVEFFREIGNHGDQAKVLVSAVLAQISDTVSKVAESQFGITGEIVEKNKP